MMRGIRLSVGDLWSGENLAARAFDRTREADYRAREAENRLAREAERSATDEALRGVLGTLPSGASREEVSRALTEGLRDTPGAGELLLRMRASDWQADDAAENEVARYISNGQVDLAEQMARRARLDLPPEFFERARRDRGFRTLIDYGSKVRDHAYMRDLIRAYDETGSVDAAIAAVQPPKGRPPAATRVSPRGSPAPPREISGIEWIMQKTGMSFDDAQNLYMKLRFGRDPQRPDVAVPLPGVPTAPQTDLNDPLGLRKKAEDDPLGLR